MYGFSDWLVHAIFGLFFLSTIAIEAFHDAYRQGILDDCTSYNFIKDRVSKIIKTLGILWAVFFLSYLAGYYFLILNYLVLRCVFFHPLFRIFLNGWGFVFSINGLVFMLKHSEIVYYYEIIFKGRRQ